MRRIGIALAAVATLLALFYVSQMVASESGEVVILTTKDAAGRPVETRLWIAEHDGDVWLRAGQLGSGWHARIEMDPDVEVERGGLAAAYLAEPSPASRAAINALMREKYGWADRYIDAVFDVSDALPIRLVPR